jgi:hypothetical protein
MARKAAPLPVPSRDSHLTFAVVWDPERGLEAYSGCDLLRLRPISDGNESFPESIRPDSRTLEDASLMSYDMASEPLRVLRHRKGRNFDSRVQGTRERRPLGRGNVNDIYLQSLSNVSLVTCDKPISCQSCTQVQLHNRIVISHLSTQGAQ